MKIYHNTILAGDAPRYDYLTDGGSRAIVPGTSRRVFNNIVLQAIGQTGGTLPPPEADFTADGNLYWTADAEAQAKGDPLTKFRKSPAVEASKRQYPPGWCRNDIFADPLLTTYAADWRQAVDLKPVPGSLAIDSGVDVPSDWPDPVRPLDTGKPDRGAIPAVGADWRVGIRGRLNAYGGPAPAKADAPNVLQVKWDLSPTAATQPAKPAIARAAIYTGYPAFDAPILAYLLRRQGTTVDVYDRTFPDSTKFANYDLIAIDGSMTRAKLETTQFADNQVPAIRAFLERGGTLVLMRERTDLFGGPAAQRLLTEICGLARKPGRGPAVIADKNHPWIAHLNAEGADIRWLASLNTSPIGATRGEVILTANENGPAVLMRASLGKGQLIYMGWSPAASMPHGREKSTVEMEESFLAQVRVLQRMITGSIPQR